MISVIFIEQFLEEENGTSLTSDNAVQTDGHHSAFLRALPSVPHGGQERDSSFCRFGWERIVCFRVIVPLFFPQTEII